ncbi:hypothetical protein [Methylobacterium sp. 285MFTsu5.1]|uniref:hypothetical protein n=1 Tax=Methylobacterium sp. 285MFTsu5.1 TaxID=1172187 RepID=UPI00035F90ED|nr:hypothetical protein [Methylobacterium sp. 285MFTsu5.1]
MAFTIADFVASIGFAADDASRTRAEGSQAKFEKAVRDSEARIERARKDGAKAAVIYALEIEAAQNREALEAAKAAKKVADAEAMKLKAVETTAKATKTHSESFVRGMTAITLAAGTMGLAVGAALGKVVGAFDNLYFASQRTGASVKNIQGLQYAFSQVGSTGASASSAIESFARQMRTNLTGGFIRSLGVATHEGGKARDTFDILSDTMDKISERQPYHTGAQMAEILGLSEEQFETFNKHRSEIKQFRSEYEATLKTVGLNSQEAAKQSEHFEQTLRRIGMQVSVAGQALLVQLLPVLDRVATSIGRFMTDNAPALNRFFVKVADLAQSAALGIEAFIKGFDGDEGAKRLRSVTDGVHEIGQAFMGLIRIGNLFVQSDFFKVLKLLTIDNPLATWPVRLLSSIAGSAQAATGGAVGAGAPAGAVPPDDRSLYQKIAPKALGGKDAPAAGDGSRSFRNNNPGNIKAGPFATSMGATGKDDKGFATFPDYATGRKAQEALLFDSKGYKDLTIAQAIARWAPAGDGNDPAGYAAQVAKAAGVGVDAPLASLTPEQRSKVLDAQQRKEGWIPGYQATASDAPAPAGTPRMRSGLATVKASNGRSFQVAAEYARNFQGFIDDYEKAGGVIGPNSGGNNERAHNASYHPVGRAIDVNQVGRGVRAGGVTLPLDVEDALAAKWGLRSGNSFRSNDNGHFEVNRAAMARAALERMKAPAVTAADAMAARPQITVPSMPKLNMSPGGFDVNKIAGQPMGAGSITTTTNNAGATVTMQPTTHVTITGGDPASNAAQFERAAGRINDSALRNIQTAIR